MGIWGAGGFENDGAQDWGRELLAISDDYSEIEKALTKVRACPGDVSLNGNDALFALAACEVLLVLAGVAQFSEGVPGNVVKWVERQQAPPSALFDLALSAVQRIQTVPSQLFEAINFDEFPEWKAAFQRLRTSLARLGSGTASAS